MNGEMGEWAWEIPQIRNNNYNQITKK